MRGWKLAAGYFLVSFWVATAGSVEAQTVGAAPDTTKQERQSKDFKGSSEMTSPSASGILFSSDALVASKVRNPAGADIGKVDQLMIDSQNGHIRYVVLAVGGFLGVNEKLYAVPWSSFSVAANEEEDKLILNMEKELLAQSPSFAIGTLPDLGSEEVVLLPSSTLIGSNVINSEGKDVGELRQLLIQSGEGRVQYAVLDIGGFLGINEKSFALPWDSLMLATGDKSQLVLNIDKQILERAPRFESSTFGTLSDSTLTDVETYYETRRPLEKTFSAEDSTTTAELSESAQDSIGIRGWSAEDSYGSKFEPSNIVTIEGQVIAKETVTPMPGMSEGVKLTVKTANDSVEVHLGPAAFLKEQNLSPTEMDRVEIEGSKVTLENKQVIFATKVTQADQIWILRDKSGKPTWSGDWTRK